jgi:hypothetical protein
LNRLPFRRLRRLQPLDCVQDAVPHNEGSKRVHKRALLTIAPASAATHYDRCTACDAIGNEHSDSKKAADQLIKDDRESSCTDD